MSSTNDVPRGPQGQATYLDYLRVLRRAGWWILPLTIISAIVAFGMGESRPKIYSARATILSPKEPIGPLPLGPIFMGANPHLRDGRGLELSLPGMQLPIPMLASNVDLYVALLKSQTMRQEVSREFDQRWGAGASSKMRLVQTDTRDKGVLGLTVEATDPQIAAEMANQYFAYLDQMLQRFAEEAIKRQELFYVTQLERAEKEIEAAQNTLLKFQTENRYLLWDVSKGVASTIHTIGNPRMEIGNLEIRRELLRMRFTEEHPEVRELEKRITELKKQYSRELFGPAMELPSENAAKVKRREFFVPAEKITLTHFEFLKLQRNLTVQESFYILALRNLEQIRYRGKFSIPAVEILDHAVSSSVPLRPDIWSLVVAAAVTALITGIGLALALEYFKQVREGGARVRIGEPGGISAGRAQGNLSDGEE